MFGFYFQCNTHKFKDKAGAFYPFTFTDVAGMVSIKTDDITTLLKGHINDGYAVSV